MQRLRPGAAAERLGLGVSTLRLYSVRFASFLSRAAARPTSTSGGRTGFRSYDERDLKVLARARDLLSQGLTYEGAYGVLANEFGSRPGSGVEGRLRGGGADVAARVDIVDGVQQLAQSVSAPPQSADAGAPENEWATLVDVLLVNLSVAQALAAEWRRIALQRA